DHDVRRIGISPTDPVAPDIDAIVSPHVQATRDALGSRIGTAHADLNTWFSMLRPCMTEDLLARAMRTTIKDAVKETDLAGLPVLASVAPSALGGRAGPRNFVDIPAGPFLERHAAMMCPYPNTIWAIVLRGDQISDWLDRSLSYFAPAGTHGPLVDPQAPAFNFDALHGLETTVDPIKPSRFDPLGNRTLGNSSRVQQVTHNGRPIDMNDRFVVAMTSFRAAGGGNFPGADADAQVIRTQIELKAALRNVVGQAVNGVSPEPPAWRFAPGLNVTRTIETAPRAEAALDQISAFAPRPLGLTDNGFLRVEVTL
ncbi:MAG: 5'-nucleotidase C-terminal domain-containing protein, partial [Tateyamaria sp.]